MAKIERSVYLQRRRNLREKNELNSVQLTRKSLSLWVIRYFFIYSRHPENIIFFKAGLTFFLVFHTKSLESINAAFQQNIRGFTAGIGIKKCKPNLSIYFILHIPKEYFPPKKNHIKSFSENISLKPFFLILTSGQNMKPMKVGHVRNQIIGFFWCFDFIPMPLFDYK